MKTYSGPGRGIRILVSGSCLILKGRGRDKREKGEGQLGGGDGQIEKWDACVKCWIKETEQYQILSFLEKKKMRST